MNNIDKFFAEQIHPSNTSWVMFKGNWRNCLFGSLKYCLKHPIAGSRILYHRLKFAALKKDFEGDLKVPEGFTLKFNPHLLCYTAIFIEENLYHKYLINELQKEPYPIILDIGFNTGMVTQWLKTYNKRLVSSGFEPIEEFVDDAYRMLQESQQEGVRINCCAIGDKEDFIDFHIGADYSIDKHGLVKETRQVSMHRLDNLFQTIAGNVFLMKIDTDGSNHLVLEGAQETLKRTRFVIIERESNCDIEYYFPTVKWKRVADLVCDTIFENRNFIENMSKKIVL